MPSVLKHTECPACGHRHHFCFLGDDLTPGQEYEYLCPETSRKGRLRPLTAPEIFRFPPQGAVVLEWVAPSKTVAAPATVPIEAESEGDGTKRLQAVLPEVKNLAAKVGGLDQLAKIVETLRKAKE
jgi:hypothetical protein